MDQNRTLSPALPEGPRLPGFADYDRLKREILALTGVDLNGYKEKQMRRRINTLIVREGYDSYETYAAVLRGEPERLVRFLDYITINVTEFFRTPDHWQYLDDRVIPALLQSTDRPLKIWSTACATGEEPYSLALSFAERMPLGAFSILATDIDSRILRKAEEGIFSETAMKTVPAPFREKYFREQEGHFAVCDQLRGRVSFQKLDLLRDSFPAECDLVVCRNVLIYFTEEAKRTVFAKCRDALKTGGFLFTGSTEQIIFPKQYGFRKEAGCLYQKEAGAEREMTRSNL